MLNMLARKYPSVARIYPTTIERALAHGAFTPGQFEIVTAYDSANELGSATVAALAELASRVTVLKRAANWN
jgi:hypothetical protein